MKIRSFRVDLIILVLLSVNLPSCDAQPASPTSTPTAIQTATLVTSSQTPAPTSTPESTLPQYNQEEINQMTPAEILAQAPELEGYEKWRAAGKYAMYLNAEGQVEKAYDMTIGEYRDIPDYPVTKPENFRDSEISPEELFNGDYFLWLQKQAKQLSCSPNMRTDVTMQHWVEGGRNLILPNRETEPNFRQEGSEFFIRDHTVQFTRLPMPDGSEVHYAVMPLFMCDLNDNTNVYPVVTVFSTYYPKDQKMYNNAFESVGLSALIEKMNITPIIAGPEITTPTREGLIDPLVQKTFEENLDMNILFKKFITNDFSALSKPGIVLLNFIATIPSEPNAFR